MYSTDVVIETLCNLILCHSNISKIQTIIEVPTIYYTDLW